MLMKVQALNNSLESSAEQLASAKENLVRLKQVGNKKSSSIEGSMKQVAGQEGSMTLTGLVSVQSRIASQNNNQNGSGHRTPTQSSFKKRFGQQTNLKDSSEGAGMTDEDPSSSSSEEESETIFSGLSGANSTKVSSRIKALQAQMQGGKEKGALSAISSSAKQRPAASGSSPVNQKSTLALAPPAGGRRAPERNPSFRDVSAESDKMPQAPSRNMLGRGDSMDNDDEDLLPENGSSAFVNNKYMQTNNALPSRPTLSKHPSMRRMTSDEAGPSRRGHQINPDDMEGADGPPLARAMSADNNPYQTGPGRGGRRDIGTGRTASQPSCEMLLNVMNPLGKNSTRSQSMGDCAPTAHQRRKLPGREGFQLEKEPSLRNLNRSLHRENSQKQLQQMQNMLQPPSQLLLGDNHSMACDDDISLCSDTKPRAPSRNRSGDEDIFKSLVPVQMVSAVPSDLMMRGGNHDDDDNAALMNSISNIHLSDNYITNKCDDEVSITSDRKPRAPRRNKSSNHDELVASMLAPVVSNVPSAGPRPLRRKDDGSICSRKERDDDDDASVGSMSSQNRSVFRLPKRDTQVLGKPGTRADLLMHGGGDEEDDKDSFSLDQSYSNQDGGGGMMSPVITSRTMQRAEDLDFLSPMKQCAPSMANSPSPKPKITSQENMSSDSDLSFENESEERFFHLLNHDPLEKSEEYDEKSIRSIIKQNSDVCKRRYEFENVAAGKKMYPLSMLCALGAELETVQMCYNAFPRAIGKNTGLIGSSLHFAAAYRAPPDVIRFLLEKESTLRYMPNRMGRLPLHMACMEQPSIETMVHFLKHDKTVVTAADKEGNLPLHHACDKGASSKVIQLLLRADFGACCIRNSKGNTPLHLAILRHAPLEVLTMLVKGNEKCIKMTDKNGNLPVHLSLIVATDFDNFKFLIEAFPKSIQAKNKSGELPIDLAKSNRKKEQKLLKFLMEM